MIPVVSKNRGPSNIKIEIVEDDQPRLSVLGYRKRVARIAAGRAYFVACCMALTGVAFGSALTLLVVRVVQGQQDTVSIAGCLGLMLISSVAATAFGLALEKIVYEAVFRRKV